MKSVFEAIKESIYEILRHHYPRIWFEIIYKRQYGHRFDWNNPQDLIEKQRWIQFKTDISEWTRLADKYQVREYIEEKGYGDILVPLLGKWDNAYDIDFNKLPDSFVLKTNHGYGEVIEVKNKTSVDVNSIRTNMDNFLRTPFGYKKAEIHYLKIKPCIIAEELLVQDGEIPTSSLIDYKFFTFHGEPKYCAVFFNRDMMTHHAKCLLYDINWHLVDKLTGGDMDIPRPVTLDKMIRACHDLASQFPFVRMDFYEVNGKLFFGEFTFTPAALNRNSSVFNPKRLVEWGKFMDLSIYKKFKESQC